MNPQSRTAQKDDSTDSFANNCSEMFSGALASELGVTNALIIRKLEVLDNDTNSNLAKRFTSCVPDNAPSRILYNYIWKPLGSRMSRELYYFDTVSLIKHLQRLCQEQYLFCKNIKGVTWYSVNFSKLNRLYDFSKFTK